MRVVLEGGGVPWNACETMLVVYVLPCPSIEGAADVRKDLFEREVFAVIPVWQHPSIIKESDLVAIRPDACEFEIETARCLRFHRVGALARHLVQCQSLSCAASIHIGWLHFYGLS